MKVKGARIAGYVLISIFGFMACFQMMLVLGVKITGAAWGSRHETLPPELRFASFVAVLIFVFLILIVLEKMGLIFLFRNPKFINGVLWFFGVYFLINTAMNAMSTGDIEKYLMTPLAFIMSVLCLVLARMKTGDKTRDDV